MPTNRIPGPRGVGDSLRAIRGLTSDPCPALDAMARRYGATFAVGARPLRLVVVGEPAHLSDLFATPTPSFRWGHAFNVLGFIVGQTSMIVSDGEDHRRRRAKVQPAFARRRLDGWVPMILAETDLAIDDAIDDAIASQEHERVIDFYPIGKHLVLKIVVQAFFGAGLRDRADEIDQIFEQLQEYIELPGPKQIPHPLPNTKRARTRAAHRRLDDLIDAEIARRRSMIDREHTDLLDVLIDGGGNGEDALSDQEIRDQVATLIGAGYHTTAASLSWTVLRALATPDVWTRLRSEADSVLDDDPGPDTLRQLTYATAVVHESLRLHPAGVFAPRQAAQDVAIGPYAIPRGSMILWSPYLAGRDPAVWPSPLEFRPDRHIDPDAQAATLMETAWVPFGKGPRRCIGFALAQMELTLIIARLAQRLDLSLNITTMPAPHGVVVNRPTGGVPVRVAPRPG